MKPLSLDAVRGLMIAAQGLDDHRQRPPTKQDVLDVIRQIRLLQVDSINVVARAPYFVLWSRLGDYDPQWLDELLEECALFEFRVIAACLMPIEDYPLHLAGNRFTDWRNPRQWLDEHAEVAAYVLDTIRKYGETRASDFKSADGQKHDWTNPKEEQLALEYLLSQGELMVRKREKFQRVYDLRERVYPAADKLPQVSREEAAEQFVLHTLRAFGVAKAEWVASYYVFKHAEAKAVLKRLEKQDRVIRVEVEGWDKPGYIHPDYLERVKAAAEGQIPQSRTTLLSPFDPLVSNRGRALDLFGFDFPIEFYFPASKRKYGYFSLPILYNNKLVGRLDPKAHRKEGIFEVKALHIEPGVVVDDTLVTAVQRVLRDCANWHQTPEVSITSEPGIADVFRME